MLIICCINFLFNTILNLRHGFFDWQNAIKFIPRLILGFHGGWQGVGVCWFIYTLALIKILFHYIREDIIRLLLVIVGLTIAYILHNEEYPIISNIQNASNAILNVCTALPFFFIGSYLRKYREELNMIKNKETLLLLLCIGTIYLYISGNYNGGNIWIFVNKYGNDIFLYIVGGLAGTLTVFSLSKLMDFSNHYIEIISKGTILILGFHGHIIGLIRHYSTTPSIMDFVYSLLIVLAFIPVIIVINKYCPLLLGKYRVFQSTQSANEKTHC